MGTSVDDGRTRGIVSVVLTIFGYLYSVLRRQMTFPFSC